MEKISEARRGLQQVGHRHVGRDGHIGGGDTQLLLVLDHRPRTWLDGEAEEVQTVVLEVVRLARRPRRPAWTTRRRRPGRRRSRRACRLPSASACRYSVSTGASHPGQASARGCQAAVGSCDWRSTSVMRWMCVETSCPAALAIPRLERLHRCDRRLDDEGAGNAGDAADTSSGRSTNTSIAGGSSLAIDCSVICGTRPPISSPLRFRLHSYSKPPAGPRDGCFSLYS